MNLEKVKKLSIPKSPGCYQFLDKEGVIIYIGKAANLHSRVLSYWRDSANHSAAKYSMMKNIKDIKWIETDSEIEALLLEANLIKKHQPQYNIALRDDKRYVYIKISTEEKYPRIFMTRNLEKQGKYFGPFVSVEAVRETLKVIRKIWPYRSCKNLPKKTCLYYRIGKCGGPCEEFINQKDYNKIIKQIIKFLEGRKTDVVKDVKKEIKIKEKNGEDSQYLKYQLLNLEKTLAHTNILSLMDKYAADVVELSKVLGLAKVPERIEGYDISNIYGKEAVGSMVVFSGGEANKTEYRKFKIKIGQGEANDTKMLKEVLERRLKRIYFPPQKEGGQKKSSLLDKEGVRGGYWPAPDLIIIDGGKAQLNAVLRILKKTKLDMAVIAISKGQGLRSAKAPDKIFFPGKKNPLELSLFSPALHLIKRVRDEAHRFAIEYHRKLRSNKFLK